MEILQITVLCLWIIFFTPFSGLDPATCADAPWTWTCYNCKQHLTCSVCPGSSIILCPCFWYLAPSSSWTSWALLYFQHWGELSPCWDCWSFSKLCVIFLFISTQRHCYVCWPLMAPDVLICSFHAIWKWENNLHHFMVSLDEVEILMGIRYLAAIVIRVSF